MDMLHKSFPCYGFKVVDAEQGIVEAIVSVYNYVDSGRDRVLYGAFNSSLKKRTPKGVRMHDWNQPVAKTLLALELAPNDPRLPQELKQYGGLYIKGQYNLDTQVGRETFSDVKFGTLDEYSIGYGVIREEQNKQLGCTDLVELDLYEWSNVLFGMNDQTTTISAKNMETKTPLADEIKTKGEALGQYAEGEMTVASISALVDILFYRVIWKCCYNWDGVTKEERSATISAALEEFKVLCMKAFEALMPEDQEEADALDMEMKMYFEPTEEKVFAKRVGVKLNNRADALSTMLADLKSRIQTALQKKEGRVFSDSNWTKLNDNTEKVGDAYDELRSLLDSAKVEKRNLNLLRLKYESELV